MQKNLIGNEKKRHRKPIGKLSVVRNFKKVIEARDIHLMKKELYEFLNLYCGFIAHYDINLGGGKWKKNRLKPWQGQHAAKVC